MGRYSVEHAGDDAWTTWCPRAPAGLSWTEVDGAYMLACPGEDRVHVLNSVGAVLLELCDGQHSVAEMRAILQRAFHLDAAPEQEVHQFLDLAIRAGLLT